MVHVCILYLWDVELPVSKKKHWYFVCNTGNTHYNTGITHYNTGITHYYTGITHYNTGINHYDTGY